MRIIDQIRSVDKLAVNHAVVDQVCTVLGIFFHYYAVLSSKGGSVIRIEDNKELVYAKKDTILN